MISGARKGWLTCEYFLDGHWSISIGTVLPSLEAEAEAGALLLECYSDGLAARNVHKLQVWKNICFNKKIKHFRSGEARREPCRAVSAVSAMRNGFKWRLAVSHLP